MPCLYSCDDDWMLRATATALGGALTVAAVATFIIRRALRREETSRMSTLTFFDLPDDQLEDMLQRVAATLFYECGIHRPDWPAGDGVVDRMCDVHHLSMVNRQCYQAVRAVASRDPRTRIIALYNRTRPVFATAETSEDELRCLTYWAKRNISPFLSNPKVCSFMLRWALEAASPDDSSHRAVSRALVAQVERIGGILTAFTHTSAKSIDVQSQVACLLEVQSFCNRKLAASCTSDIFIALWLQHIVGYDAYVTWRDDTANEGEGASAVGCHRLLPEWD